MLWVLVLLIVGSRRRVSYDLQMKLAPSYIQIMLQDVQYDVLRFRLCLFIITYHISFQSKSPGITVVIIKHTAVYSIGKVLCSILVASRNALCTPSHTLRKHNKALLKDEY